MAEHMNFKLGQMGDRQNMKKKMEDGKKIRKRTLRWQADDKRMVTKESQNERNQMKEKGEDHTMGERCTTNYEIE